MKEALLILVTVLGSAHPVYAQTHITRTSGRLAIESIATCAIEQQRSDVVSALTNPRDYKQDTVMMRNVMGKTCVPRGYSVTIDPEFYRGALFRALVRADYGNAPSKFSSSVLINETGTWASILAFADCVVRSDPASAHDAIVATVDGEAEKTAFGALEDPINKCKPWDKVSWNKDWLISFFSEAYYQEASHANLASSN
jgi:hypothetical protein